MSDTPNIHRFKLRRADGKITHHAITIPEGATMVSAPKGDLLDDHLIDDGRYQITATVSGWTVWWSGSDTAKFIAVLDDIRAMIGKEDT